MMSSKHYRPAHKKLMAPWTPVEVETLESGVAVKVWGRTYEFAAGPLPTAITALGENLLSKPIKLTGTIAGKEFTWSPEGAGVIVHTHTESEAIIVGFARTECGEMTFNSACHIEYDGTMWIDVKVMPGNGPSDEEPLLLDKLHLEIPFKPAKANLFHYWPHVHMGTGPNISAENAGAVSNIGMAMDFKPFLWLGNEESGLCWFAENDRHWQPEAGKALEVTRDNDSSTTLRVHFLDSVYAPWRDNPPTWRHRVGPQVFRFGIQATPVKPRDEAYAERRIAFHHGYTITDVKDAKTGKTILDHMIDTGVTTIAFHEQWQPIQNYGFTNALEEVRKSVELCHSKGLKCLAYFGYELASLAPEWGEHCDDWLVRNLDGVPAGGWRREPHQRDYIVCSNSGWQDKLLENMCNAIEACGFDGVYLDQTNVPFGCSCELHDCGWRDEAGELHLHFPIRSARNLMQRLYEFLQPRGGIIDLHQSSGCVMPTMSFAHSYFDTEHLIWEKRFAEDPFNAVGLDTMRAEFMGWNWGVPAEYMACSGSWAFTLIHGVINRPIDRQPDETDKVLWATLKDFGWGQADFHGYWNNQAMLSVNHRMLRASVFVRNDLDKEVKALLILGNLTGRNQGAKPIDATLKINYAALGIDPASASLDQVITGDGATLEGNSISCTLDALETGLFILSGTKD
jgi:hypothetical protein